MAHPAPSSILVVDDDPLVLEVLRSMLRLAGYQVTLAGDCESALAELERIRPGVVLCDIVLPGASGMTLLYQARERFPDTPVIMMTGHPNVQTAAESVRAGAFDYLTKARLRETVIQSVARAVRVRSLREEKLRLERENRLHQQQLEAAHRNLEAFSHSIAHDLGTPLMRIDDLAQALLEDHTSGVAPEARRYLELVRNSAHEMRQMIDHLLAFSRLGRVTLNRSEVTPSVLVRQIADDLLALYRGRQIRLSLGDMPQCHGDPGLLKHVWANLLSNAFKFTRRREVAEIEVGFRDAPAAFFVKDNGVGFDMKLADRLFGVFQRLHSTADYEGTGAGLAIVQRIIQCHGGRIWAEAEPDRGAAFYFTLGE